MVCIWSVAQRSLVKAVTRKAAVSAVDFALDGQTVFVGLDSGAVEVLDLRGKLVRTMHSKDAVLDLRILANGMLVTLGWKQIAIVDPVTGKVLCKLPRTQGAQSPKITDLRGDMILTRGPAAILRIA